MIQNNFKKRSLIDYIKINFKSKNLVININWKYLKYKCKHTIYSNNLKIRINKKRQTRIYIY